MPTDKNAVIILIADDDPDDRLLIKEALEEAKLNNPVHFVEDGIELLDYLKRENKYRDLAGSTLPGLVLLDLNMPRKNGIEALEEIKEDQKLRAIPVVVFTTSKAEEDILRAYQLGVNSFITKPINFQGLLETVEIISRYWFNIVELPG
ncbi:MAG: response regulator [Bacteroidota bacterium]